MNPEEQMAGLGQAAVPGEVPPAGEMPPEASALPGGPPPPEAGIAGLESAFGEANTKYKKLAEAAELIGRIRSELDQLVVMGDTVTPEDVVRSAGVLVAAGAEPLAMAGLLAEMPSTGGAEALAGWLAERDMGLQQKEAQLEFVKNATQHQMGVAGMRVLMAHSAQQLVADSMGGDVAPQAPEEQPMPPARAGASKPGNALMTGAM